MEEFDDEDAKLRLFAQSFYSEIKKWFKALLARSINTFVEFEEAFFRRWEDKKNPLQILTLYNNLKRGGIESIQ